MEGIIFDLDGVIALTEAVHREAFDMAFAGYHIDMCKYDWDKDFAGKGHRFIIDTVFGRSPGNDRLIDLWVHKYQVVAAHKIRPVPGIIKYINSKSIPMIIATGSVRRSAEIVLKSLKINLPLVSMEDAPNPKPDPGLFLLAASRINTEPKYCMVFEDSIYGIRAAKTAGMKVIALNTTHSRELLKTENPDMIINDFTELINKVQYPQFEER
jgi:HAD superfamily hydrolase (TIGR01549 family)